MWVTPIPPCTGWDTDGSLEYLRSTSEQKNRALVVQPVPRTSVQASKQNSGPGLLPAGLFAHIEQDFRGRVKPVLTWSPAAGAGAASPPKAQSVGQPNPTSAGETHCNRSAQNSYLHWGSKDPCSHMKPPWGTISTLGWRSSGPLVPSEVASKYHKPCTVLQCPCSPSPPSCRCCKVKMGPELGWKQPVTNAKSSRQGKSPGQAGVWQGWGWGPLQPLGCREINGQHRHRYQQRPTFILNGEEEELRMALEGRGEIGRAALVRWGEKGGQDLLSAHQGPGAMPGGCRPPLLRPLALGALPPTSPSLFRSPAWCQAGGLYPS